jgi:hypothetical protein
MFPEEIDEIAVDPNPGVMLIEEQAIDIDVSFHV